MRPTRLFLADDGSHRVPSGYGKNSRSLIRTLGRHKSIDLAVQESSGPWLIDDQVKKRLGEIREASSADLKDFDLVLQIGTPLNCRLFPIPSLMFSYCDTSEPTPEAIDKLRLATGVIAPNTANFNSYSRHFPVVYKAFPGIDDFFFKKSARYRAEGSHIFTFMFVGTFSYRKGADLLVDAFIQEFRPDEARLFLHLPSQFGDRAATAITKRTRKLKRSANVSVSTANLSEAWMARFYNRSDCFITCTRGEGWGLPIVEAMLCELPVISSFKTAMADFLADDVAFELETSRVRILDIESSFGRNFRQAHGSGDAAVHEPTIDSIRRQMRHVLEHGAEAAEVGHRARAHILSSFSEEEFGLQMVEAISCFRAGLASNAPEI